MARIEGIEKVLVIGSGPIVIGQAAEFDYAGTQACLKLKELGYKVVLINSNPATIMTDKNICERVYMEPLDLEYVARIIRLERPDALLPHLGGQTGLNLAMQLYTKGILDECNCLLLGNSYESIQKAEDRDEFKKLCQELGEPTIESDIAHNLEECISVANKIGYPVVIRPAFTLGGTGGGFAYNETELIDICKNALVLSPVSQVLIEKSIKGYKEVEFEVIRDSKNQIICVCDMENVDPVGVHTGDSVVIAPSQTLDKETLDRMRNSAFKIIEALKIEGGCNVQYALSKDHSHYYLIEVNPRVSRSSALASKATGYPIAKVTTEIALGYTLDEIRIGTEPAYFNPCVDYTVCKIPRFYFDKFEKASRILSTQMKATGEVMSIGQSFNEALLKGIRSLETKRDHLYSSELESKSLEELYEILNVFTDQTLFVVAEVLRREKNIDEIVKRTQITPYFIKEIEKIIDIENELKQNLNEETLLKAKLNGFSDSYISKITNVNVMDIRNERKKYNITPKFKMLKSTPKGNTDYIPYFYSTYEQSSNHESVVTNNKKVIVLGSGPIRIGQGVEFDYSTVHAIWTLKELGYEAIVINNNPETVSTDYTISDKLYFEPLTPEDVYNILDLEQPYGVIATLGGQTAINLCESVEKYGANILGCDTAAINYSEDRFEFERILRELKIKQPVGKTVFTIEEGLKWTSEIGYPVLVRPSYVLGGRNMEIVYSDEQLIKYLEKAIIDIEGTHPILIDKYVTGKEVELDAICDLKDVFIPGIMEHIEKAGVHSGDSMSVYPTFTIGNKTKEKIATIAKKLGVALKIKGLFNIQFIVDKNDDVYVIEVNPRSSRTVPFISKVTNCPLANIATKVIMGYSLKELGYVGLKNEKNRWYVKAPTFSYSKIVGLDAVLSPEMKSTGEAIGYDDDFNRAVYKALKASNLKLSNYGTVFVTLNDETKEEALPIIRRIYNLGFNIEATKGTATFLKNNNIKCRSKQKISEGSEEILESIRKGYVKYVVNTPSKSSNNDDGSKIRRCAVENNVTMFTCLDTFNALVNVLEEITLKVSKIDD